MKIILYDNRIFEIAIKRGNLTRHALSLQLSICKYLSHACICARCDAQDRAKVKRNEHACVLFRPTNNDGLGFRVVLAIIRLHRLTSPSRSFASFSHLDGSCLASSRLLANHIAFRLSSTPLVSSHFTPCFSFRSFLLRSLFRCF